MTKIISINLNSAIDHHIEIDKFKLGSVIRAKESILYASGKAINSTRTISCLKKNITAFCFVGKNEAHFYNQLKSKYIKLNLFKVEEITRSNITIVDSNHNLITHLQTNGYKLKEELLHPFINQIEKQISKDDVVIISGGIPNGIPDDYYKILIELCNKKGSKVVFDSSGKYLKNGIKSNPFVIKPNIKELEELSGRKISNLAGIVKEAKELNKKGIELVFISRGEKGVVLTKRGETGYWTANVKIPLIKHEGDNIGCGDAMVGGIAVSLFKDNQIEDILKMAVACGAANILSKGPGICKLSDVNLLSKQVIIKFVSKKNFTKI